MSEAEALLLDRSMRFSPQESALEQGWLLSEMEQRFEGIEFDKGSHTPVGPMSAVFGAWLLRDIFVDLFRSSLRGMWFMQGLGITVAIIAVLVVIAVRRRIDMGSSLVLHLSIG